MMAVAKLPGPRAASAATSPATPKVTEAATAAAPRIAFDGHHAGGAIGKFEWGRHRHGVLTTYRYTF